jgi:hypothetical protein
MHNTQLVPAVTELMVAELLYLEKQGPSSLPIEMLINSSGTTRQDGEIVSRLAGYARRRREGAEPPPAPLVLRGARARARAFALPSPPSPPTHKTLSTHHQQTTTHNTTTTTKSSPSTARASR